MKNNEKAININRILIGKINIHKLFKIKRTVLYFERY